MLVINLFAGPGVGKTTLASEIFVVLKKAGVNVELVSEYAKQLTWEKRIDVLDDQIYVFAKQSRALRRVRDQVDVVITDAPLLQSCAYIGEDVPDGFAGVVNEIFSQYTNMNFFLERHTDYQPSGRNQDENGAKELDEVIRSLLFKYKHCHTNVNPRESGLAVHIADLAIKYLL